jgi:ankyrin repeat protein/beta-lactamase regulating signal transducer with metallopeptidase domain
MIRELFLQDLSLSSCVWQSTLLMVIGLVGSLLLRHRPARAFQVLFLTMIAAVVVPAMTALVKHFELGVFVAEPVTLQPISMDLYSAVPLKDPEAMIDPQVNTKGHLDATLAEGGSTGIYIPWREILLLGWMTATLALLGRLFVAFMNGVCMIGRSQPDVREHIQQALGRATSRLGVKNKLQIRASGEIHSPMIWCWSRKAVLLVPRDLNNNVDWVGVICHELAHYMRRDHICGLMAELTACILCWNPLSWLAKKRLVRLGEQACDDWVVAGGQPVENYARSLLNFKPQKQSAFVPAVVHSRKGVAARVRRILKDSCINPRTGVVWAFTVSILSACIAIGIACAQTRPAKQVTITREDKKKLTESLQKAVAEGDIEQVKSLISKGADLNVQKEIGNSLLHSAAWYSNEKIMEMLISRGADVNAKNKRDYTPLYSAVWANKINAVKVLVNEGCDVNWMPKGDSPPIHYAIWAENIEMAKFLVNSGADFNLKDHDGWTAFHYAIVSESRELADSLIAKGARISDFHFAAWRGDLAAVKNFIEKGIDINIKDDQLNWTALHWAACSGKNDVADCLITNGADVNAKGEFEDPVLHYAIIKGNKYLVEQLLAKGAEVNVKDVYEQTNLQIASGRGHRDIVEMLIAHGADINAKGAKGQGPLLCAARNGHTEIVSLLIAKGADINTKDVHGQAPLNEAASDGYKETAELLITKGADVNAKNNKGITPLYAAADNGHKDIVEMLTEGGADVDAKDKKGQTALQMAVLNGYKDIAEILIAKGADVNAKSNTWETTPLIAAIRRGHEGIAKLLIAKGANVSGRGLGDYTPLHWAACNRARMAGVTNIMRLLLEKGADIEARQEHDATPLACATYDGNTETTKFLIEHGANMETKLNDGETTPLLRAVSQQHVDTARLLLNKGANIHATWRGLSAVHVAMLSDRLSNRKSDREMVKLLIERGLKSPSIHLAAFYGDLQKLKNCLIDGTKVDGPDAAGWTALHCAVCGDHMDVVKFLLDNGANVNARTQNGWTPLAFVWPVDMAKLLIANGADVRIADERGQTALHWAVNRDNHRGDKALIELLLKHGADINARAASTSLGWAGWTPLHVACRNGARDIVELLVAHGGDVTAKTDKGETPMAIAQSNRHGQVVQFLRSQDAQE